MPVGMALRLVGQGCASNDGLNRRRPPVRTILGHASGFTTEVYAELDHEKARAVMGRVG